LTSIDSFQSEAPVASSIEKWYSDSGYFFLMTDSAAGTAAGVPTIS